MVRIIKILTMLLVVSTITISGCTRASKSCKANHKKVKQMRKSGQIRM